MELRKKLKLSQNLFSSPFFMYSKFKMCTGVWIRQYAESKSYTKVAWQNTYNKRCKIQKQDRTNRIIAQAMIHRPHYNKEGESIESSCYFSQKIIF